MKRITLMLVFLFAISWQSQAQLFISEDFDSGVPSTWSGDFSSSSTNACEGESARDNMYSSSANVELVTSNYEGISNGTDLTVSFDYKVIDFGSGNPATDAGWGTAELQYSTDDGTTWNTFFTIDDSNHVVSADCATVTGTVPAASIPSGSDIKLRVAATWSTGDYYFYIDNFETAQVIDCTFPEVTTELVEDCVNGTFTINVDVTDLGDATSLTLTNDAGAPSVPVTSTGVIPFGPVPVGTVVNLALEHDGDSDCNLDLGTFKDTCPAPNDTITGAIPITPSAPGTGCDTFTFSYDFGDGSVSDSGLDTSCNNENTGHDLFFTWTATSSVLVWNGGDANPGIAIRQPDGTEITCAASYAPDDTILTGWNIGDELIIQVYDTYSGATDTSFCLEELTCPVPSNIVLDGTSVTATTADFSWDASPAEELGYEWLVMAEGEDPEVDTPVHSGTTDPGETSLTVTGLTDNTTYDFYLQANCDANGLSDYLGPETFVTACETIVPDYLEDFSDFTPGCWEEAEGGDFTTGPDSYGSSSWLADGFLNNEGTGAARVNLYTDSREEWLISPSFDLSGDGYELVFDIGITEYTGSENSAMGSDDEFLVLYTADGVTWTELQSWEAGNEPSNTGETITIDLTGITGTDVQFAFYATDGSVNDTEDYNIYVDNFNVRTPLTCPEITDLSVGSISSTGADLSWTDNAEAVNGYEWIVMAEGEDPEVDTPVSTGTTAAGESSVTVTGLSADTNYDAYVIGDCDVDGMSPISPLVNFLTSCEATDIPFVQDFESVTVPELPNCGTLETIGDSNDWKTHNQTSNGFDSNVLRYRYSSSDADTWYFTQGISLEAGVEYEISYQYGNNSTSYTEKLKVAYGTSASAASMTENIDDHTISLSGSEVNEVIFTVPADGVYYFGFHAYSVSGQYYLYVDNIEVDIAPTCIKPSNVVASNITGSSFDIEWDAISTEVNGYEWLVMAEGEDPEVDTPVETGVTATGETTATITGLTETTSYDVYVRTDCDTDGLSDYSNVLTVETTVSCAAPTEVELNEPSLTSSTVEFTWTVSASEELGYDWYVMAEGEGPEDDTPINSGTTNPGDSSVTVTGLTAATAYDFYIQSNCDANGMSDYVGPESFTTACDTFVPDYLEDFSDFTPVCWEEAEGGDFTTGPDSYGSSSWLADGFLNNEGTGAARVNLYTDSREEWLISPSFDLSADGYELIFDIGITAFSGSGDENMGSDDEVYVLYSTDGTTWTELQSWEAGNKPSNTGETVTIDLTGITGADVQFAFYATDGSVNDTEDYNIYVDNFNVRTPLACPEVTGLSVDNISSTGADLSWTDNAEAVNGYEWFVMAEGEDPEVDTPIQTGTTAAGEASVTVSGLAFDTVYDAYVVGNCDADGTSPYAMISFETLIGTTIVTPGTTESGTYCYENNDFKEWLFESSDGSALTIEFIEGTLESSPSGTYDDLMIYDGSDDTGAVLYDSDDDTVDGELAGTIVTAPSGMIYMTLDSDGSNSCDSGGETEIVFNVDADVTTGNQDFFSDVNFSYYPNPVKSSFEINSTYELEQVVIYNMLGQEVRDISPKSTDVRFDLSDVQAGVYIVKATVEGQTQTFRLIKE